MLVQPNPYDQISQLKQAVREAQEVILHYIVPDGITADLALAELIGIFDNADIMEVLSNVE